MISNATYMVSIREMANILALLTTEVLDVTQYTNYMQLQILGLQEVQ
mgnify:CR=1 FL=1